MLKKTLLLLVGIFIMQSCASKKNILYYQDIKDSSQNAINYVSNEIQVNDILYITVDALIPESAKPFNLNLNSPTLNTQTIKIQGYLVSQQGTITFPILGELKVAGKSTLELQQMLTKILNDRGYINDANVNVRVINGKVTVLGEVNNPGTYSFDEQNISLNQAIGYAGDLTINGIRKDVLLIRENNGTRSYIKLDLTSSSWFTSPYYYVKQNDVIIVNPNGAKVMTSGYLSNIGSILSIMSIGVTLFLLLKK
ncbi:polysaccharide biosynthesis/export family protein [Flavobacterium paronense]|uniref:Polysaccharide biosynthesis/export family protein n=1 Tax=Flavobacterium paronense TaxID=1392775 RepID=A0ABV5GAP8_9FLAO|nr:polysaccharide biosynthesis/export family protein [Flavobacterium paronense]MDN3676695.1 polysaccharide biosynthesis/export family protein [Flavobacterium paronense]